jgi:hypothetical protein
MAELGYPDHRPDRYRFSPVRLYVKGVATAVVAIGVAVTSIASSVVIAIRPPRGRIDRATDLPSENAYYER